MKKFIIIGFYEDKGQSFADSVEAEDAFKAFEETANEYPDVTLVQAVQLPDGECTAPCDDSGNICAAEDYPKGEPHISCCGDIEEVVQEEGLSHWVCQECGNHYDEQGKEV